MRVHAQTQKGSVEELNYPSTVSHYFHLTHTYTHISQVKLADGRLVKGGQHGPDVAEPTVQKAKGFDLPHHRGTTAMDGSCSPSFKERVLSGANVRLNKRGS